ncbi:selenide, water dikinase [Methanolacinia petrolearia DSM 11571]|uniref:Selenide, water dikinase n=1 Tax=Methanolacinia petrolearia (strain DSM 11571 / OCM 486 / SEBR 4847) TaxID=679926 RepID=E1RJH9_METP4|nr:selenide, water dikinase SelD [Methanolacinia petrolearia]ADN36785.1 selenide, water dikinase [Methanolacinia petrolearia DSM 11571]
MSDIEKRKLTSIAPLFGCSCKLPETELETLLEDINISYSPEILCPGDDAAVIKINDDLAIIKTTDFFTPIVDDPYIQGKIAACNATNDVYAMGATEIVGVLALLGIPRELPLENARMMLKGFQDFCNSIGTSIVGGHTIINPWPFIGGAVTAISSPDKIVYHSGAQPGDVLLLTKPLGIQPAMASTRLSSEYSSIIQSTLDSDIVANAVNLAIECMTTSNLNAAKAINEVGANALTDVTGFGLYGHGLNIARKSNVSLNIDLIPIISGTLELSALFEHGLEEGKSAETAGGLLMSVSEENLDEIIHSLNKYNVPAYEIGTVKEKGNEHVVIDNPEILEISSLSVKFES